MTNQNNLVVLRGSVTHEPICRELAAGSVISFDLASVPVAVYDPTPAVRAAITPDSELVVVGSVHRRFFRTGGATQSRTEVVADKVIPARRTKTARQVILDSTEAVRRGGE